jgi:hypothetical protein
MDVDEILSSYEQYVLHEDEELVIECSECEKEFILKTDYVVYHYSTLCIDDNHDYKIADRTENGDVLKLCKKCHACKWEFSKTREGV